MFNLFPFYFRENEVKQEIVQRRSIKMKGEGKLDLLIKQVRLKYFKIFSIILNLDCRVYYLFFNCFHFKYHHQDCFKLNP